MSVKTDAAELQLLSFSLKAETLQLVQVDMIEIKKLNKPTGGKIDLHWLKPCRHLTENQEYENHTSAIRNNPNA